MHRSEGVARRANRPRARAAPPAGRSAGAPTFPAVGCSLIALHPKPGHSGFDSRLYQPLKIAAATIGDREARCLWSSGPRMHRRATGRRNEIARRPRCIVQCAANRWSLAERRHRSCRECRQVAICASPIVLLDMRAIRAGMPDQRERMWSGRSALPDGADLWWLDRQANDPLDRVGSVAAHNRLRLG